MTTRLVLPAGVKRQIYIDVKRMQHRTPNDVIVRQDEPGNGVTITHCQDVEGNGAFRLRSNVNDPITPTGPAAYVETDVALILTFYGGLAP